ncbi:Mus7/MMS22 family-domain-containing protein [Russula earlei]|uniref:Mus7/MMS22 family-domain-containing protein n=1 Tax=Russula earlei TaxID=71964 RepID=A0ACC0UDI1_9AGAM|nr:Mus7/MMS22 family-domain-containing protein [Russula earlei]
MRTVTSSGFVIFCLALGVTTKLRRAFTGLAAPATAELATRTEAGPEEGYEEILNRMLPAVDAGQVSSYLLMNVDVPLDAASTSDADERELLEAASSDLYWDRVIARGHLHSHPPNPMSHQGNDTKWGASQIYRRSAYAVDTHSSTLCPGPHTPSSEAPYGSLNRTAFENITPPVRTDWEPPTSSPVSSFPARSLSVSSLFPPPCSPSRYGAIGNHSMSSPDPLQLVSPATRLAGADDHHFPSTGHDAGFHMAAGLVRQDLCSNPGPSASPSSSRHLFCGFSLQPSGSRRHLSSPDPSTAPAPPTTEVNHDQISALEANASPAGGRYSMRTRQPRQLKPYAFDRMEYTHQLKHHPDAIVKFRGHRIPAESSSSSPSCSAEGDTDGAPENVSGERPSKDVRFPPHAKQKKRPRTNTHHPSAPPPAPPRVSGVQLSRGSLSPNGRSRGSSATVDRAVAVSIPDLGIDDNLEEAAAWYPDAFNDLSSALGSDDAVPLRTVQNDLRVNDTLPPQIKRRRRAPRRLPRLSPLTSPVSHSSGRSFPLSKPALLGAISLDTSSDTSSSASESTRSSDDVTLLSEESALVLVDDHAAFLAPKQECSLSQTFPKRRLRPSAYPVITDFFVRGDRGNQKRRRKHGIAPPEKHGRSKHASGNVRVKDRRNSKARVRRRPGRPQQPADLSVFTVAGGRVLSGWQRRNAVTIDTEDLAFRKALEPLAHRPRPPPIRPPSEMHHLRRLPRQILQSPVRPIASSSMSKGVDLVPSKETRRRIVVDFEIPFLSSGKVYTASSYLGKGWLYELLSIVSGTPLSHPPPAVEVDGHRLSPVSSALDYTVFLPYACDSFAKVLNDPLAMSHEEFTSWSSNMHAVCSLVSWILASPVGNHSHLIRTASLEYTGSLIARIDTVLEDSDDRAKSLCSSILFLYWFAVELLVRACVGASGSEEDLSTAISARVAGIVDRLLQVGLHATVSHVVANHELLDDFSSYPCAAELWICVVHLGTVRASGAGNFPSVVEILQQSLLATESVAQGGLHASEEIWCTLFGLSALSQFSAHGVSTSSARMGASWELVLLALDYIRLVVEPQTESDLSARSLRRRDAYIRLVVSRCLILHQRWCWRLDDDASATLFRRLVEVFKSRKFADLRGEVAGFAAFVQENDARLLAEHSNTDSAFTILLKLIYASAEQMRPALSEDEYLSRTKKLLSLVTPVGSVQLGTPRWPYDERLSMLYNRFSSLALAIRILPSAENVLYRVSLARRYVDFRGSAAPTRSVCIRAAAHLALQALDMALPVGPALEWTSEIAQILMTEFRAVAVPPADDDARGRRSESVQCIQLVLSGLLDMSRAISASAGCLFPVLAEVELGAIPTIQVLVQGIVDAHLDLALSLQEEAPPHEQHEQQQQRHPVPQPTTKNQEESQDEYGQFDLNWDDPMVLAALDDAAAPAPPTTMQYTYQSIVEHIKSAAASPVVFEAIISAFQNQRRQRQGLTAGGSVP